jgi:hypothetical protein
MGVFNPEFATYRLDQVPDGPSRPHPLRVVGHQQGHRRRADRRVGLLASHTSPRTAIVIAGLLILTTPLLLPRPDRGTNPSRRRAGLPAS